MPNLDYGMVHAGAACDVGVLGASHTGQVVPVQSDVGVRNESVCTNEQILTGRC